MRSKILTEAFRHKPSKKSSEKDDDDLNLSELNDTRDGDSENAKSLIKSFTSNYFGLKRIKSQSCLKSYFQCTEGRRYRKLIQKAHWNVKS